ncbi:RDD family protein [Rhodovulum sp. YNF3179]|uniref:RDD family protein n=1 Tax=Rhodovulum sp. YNF3179 TaxID=3425127 RepID=UPI003D34A3C4
MIDDALWGLPDPDRSPEFYDGVPFKRLLAWLVDTILVTLATLLIVAATLFVTVFIFPAIFLAVHLAYRIFFLARDSATPGMRLVAIEIRTHRGDRLDAGMAALHTLAYSVIAGFVLPQVVGIVMMLTTARGQGLHDMLLGTTAINRPAERF